MLVTDRGRTRGRELVPLVVQADVDRERACTRDAGFALDAIPPLAQRSAPTPEPEAAGVRGGGYVEGRLAAERHAQRVGHGVERDRVVE